MTILGGVYFRLDSERRTIALERKKKEKKNYFMDDDDHDNTYISL
jgi:hypothetical protein